MNKDIISNCLKEIRLKNPKGTIDREVAELASNAYNSGKSLRMNYQKAELENLLKNIEAQNSISQLSYYINLANSIKARIDKCQKEIEDLKEEIIQDEVCIANNDDIRIK